MLPKRAFYRLLKKEVKRVQTHFRMWSDRRVYLFFKRQVHEMNESCPRGITIAWASSALFFRR